MPATATSAWARRWQRFSAASVRGFHTYANWLVGISWRRFVVLSVLLMIFAGVLQHIPPFSWSFTRTVSQANDDRLPPEPPTTPSVPGRAGKPSVHIEPPGPGGNVEIVIDERGVRITPRGKAAASAAPAAPAVSAAASATGPAARASTEISSAASDHAAPSVVIRLPPGSSAAVKAAVEEARQAIEEALQEARQEAESARRDAEQAACETPNKRCDRAVASRWKSTSAWATTCPTWRCCGSWRR